MKKFVTLLILTIVFAFTFSSCNVDDGDESNYQFQFAIIDSVKIPQQLVLGETKQIKVYFNKPSTCHFYNGFYYEKNENIRTFAVQMAVYGEPNCTPLEDEVTEATFDFYVSNTGSYLFKFYKGDDATGQNTFLEYEIPVVPQ